ncbi:SDR family NAD(P)-dependent oxidoreductase [Pseudomonas californiensis]|nr:SDR family oxidoreductase [Pseudomonas californiensis]
MPEPIRSVLVTGASSGIGHAIVTRLLEQGLQVIGLSRRAPDLQHENFTWLPCDLNDFEALDQALSKTPGIDALIHAAGFMRTAPLGQLSDADGQAMWHLHVAAASHLVNALYPSLRSGSRILLIGSRTMQGAAGRSQYAATKAALQGMVRSWAMELAPRGITVNLIAPGATETPMLLDPARRLPSHRLAVLCSHRKSPVWPPSCWGRTLAQLPGKALWCAAVRRCKVASRYQVLAQGL